MGSVREIEQAIQSLSPEALAEFRNWFAEYDADAWDRQIEQDAKAGKLDSLADAALRQLRAGKVTEL